MFSILRQVHYFLVFSISLLYSQDVFVEISSFNDGFIEIYMENTSSVAGFQMNIESSFDDFVLGDTYGGSSEDNGFFISVGSPTVLGFSLTGSTIAPGSGTLFNIAADFNDDSGYFELNEIVISDADGNALDVESPVLHIILAIMSLFIMLI